MPYTLGDNVICKTLLPTQVGTNIQPTTVHASSVTINGAALPSMNFGTIEDTEILTRQDATNASGSRIKATTLSDPGVAESHDLAFFGFLSNVVDFPLGILRHSATIATNTFKQQLFPRTPASNPSQNPLTLQAVVGSNDVRVGVNVASPTCDLDVAGDVNFSGALQCSGDAGTSGQVLTSNGGSISWTTPSSGGGGLSVYAYVTLDVGERTLVSGDYSGSYHIIEYNDASGMHNAHTKFGAASHRPAPQESHSGILSSLTNGTDVSLTVPSGEAGGYLIHASMQFHTVGYTADLGNIHFELFSTTKNITVRQKLLRHFTGGSTTLDLSDIHLGMMQMAYLDANENIICRITNSSVGDVIGKFTFGFAKLH